ncbi:MAG: dihydropteroate synthase, partial [Planctomycetes bacterium]|nr:dihydropteroate synthase [Planctomycetota bacterium]
MPNMTRILGILNLTRDSFSDGGRFLEPDAAVAHARQLVADGADVVDLGAESTHPDSEDVSAEEEIARLTPVIETLKAEGVRVSVDTYKPAVMRRVLESDVDYINDVTALRDPASIAAVRDSDVRLILMHSRSAAARAERAEADPATIVDDIIRFFDERISTLTAAGIARYRLILDPGMGFFLGSNSEVSLAVLRDLRRLRKLNQPILISTSRKSFIGAVLGATDTPRPVDQRGPGTLATEIWAVQHGAAYIRTHDVRA